MKSSSVVVLSFITAVCAAWAEPPVATGSVASPIGILPMFKRGATVDRNERNPFGSLVEAEPEAVATGVEATTLTTILESLPIAGLSRDTSGQVRSILLGDLRLEAGALVPQLIEGQTDELIVQTLTDQELVIAWRLEAGRTAAQTRLLRRKLDFSPKVEVILPGQGASSISSSKESRRAIVVVRGKSPTVPDSIVPTSGLPPAKP